MKDHRKSNKEARLGGSWRMGPEGCLFLGFLLLPNLLLNQPQAHSLEVRTSSTILLGLGQVWAHSNEQLRLGSCSRRAIKYWKKLSLSKELHNNNAIALVIHSMGESAGYVKIIGV